MLSNYNSSFDNFFLFVTSLLNYFVILLKELKIYKTKKLIIIYKLD